MNVDAFTATSGDTQIFLSWVNPTNKDFAGVLILRKTGGYSTNKGDGVVAYSGPGTSAIENSLTNGTEYFYSAFAFDTMGRYSTIPAQKKAIPIKGSWFSFFGGAGIQVSQSVIQTTDGGYIVCGYAAANVATLGGKTPLIAYGANSDFMVVKLTTEGVVSWYTFLGGTAGNDPGSSVTQTIDGGYVLFGRSDNAIPTLGGQTPLNSRNALDDFLVIKLTPAGAVSWYTFLGGSGWDNQGVVGSTSDGGVILVGRSAADIPNLAGQVPIIAFGGVEDCVVLKLDAAGGVSWYTFLGGSATDQGKWVSQTTDGGYIVSGHAAGDIPIMGGQTPLNAYSAGQDGLIVKLTPTGTVSWYTFIGGAGTDSAGSVAQTTDGGFVLLCTAGANIPNLSGQTPLNAYSAVDDLLAVKLNASGAVSWYTFLGAAGTDQGNAIAATTDGGAILLGAANANVPNLSGKSPINAYNAAIDFMAVKLGASGGVNWYTFLGGTGNDIGYSVMQTSDGGYVFAGSTTVNIPNLGGQTPLLAYSSGEDFLVVKLKANGGF